MITKPSDNNYILETYEPRAEVQALIESANRPSIISDPISAIAMRQIVDAIEFYVKGCTATNFNDHQKLDWQIDREWLVVDDDIDRPFSLDWCAETLRAISKVKIDVRVIRAWARSVDPSRPHRPRRAFIVPLEGLGADRGEMAAPS